MASIIVGKTIYRKGRIEVFKLRNGFKFGFYNAITQQVFKPETRRKLLICSLGIIELQITLDEGKHVRFSGGN